MAATSRALWLINISLLLTLNFSGADGSGCKDCRTQSWRQDQTSATQPTIRDLPDRPDANSPLNDPNPTVNKRKRQNTTVEFDKLPEGYKSAFKSVKQLNDMADQISASRRKMVDSQINRRTNRTKPVKLPGLFVEFGLAGVQPQSTVSEAYSTRVPGTWKTYVEGCCPAWRYFSGSETLRNIYGIERRILNFNNYNPPMYQLLQYEKCVRDKYGQYGHCIQGYVTMRLAVYDLSFSPPIAFDYFDIPSFCYCVQY
ncbi:hypothetical protein BsWGS_00491 [Bradybaena similaris]